MNARLRTCLAVASALGPAVIGLTGCAAPPAKPAAAAPQLSAPTAAQLQPKPRDSAVQFGPEGGSARQPQLAGGRPGYDENGQPLPENVERLQSQVIGQIRGFERGQSRILSDATGTPADGVTAGQFSGPVDPPRRRQAEPAAAAADEAPYRPNRRTVMSPRPLAGTVAESSKSSDEPTVALPKPTVVAKPEAPAAIANKDDAPKAEALKPAAAVANPPVDPKAPIVAAGTAVAGNADPKSLSPTNTPADVAVSSEYDAMARRILQHRKESPQDVAAHLDALVLDYLRTGRTPDVAAVGGLTPDDREILSAFLDGMANFRQGVESEENWRASDRVRPLLAMAERVRERAGLSIPTMTLCSVVTGFGTYEPMPTRFKAGLDSKILVYCEVENFLSKLTDKQRWETKLALKVELFTASDGSAIWSDNNTVKAEPSRNRRRDFFVIKPMTLPKTLAAGRYTLKVTVNDLNAERMAENQLEITLAAQ